MIHAKKRTIKWLAAAILAATLAFPAAASAGTPVYLRLAWDGGGESMGSGGILKDGRVYVPSDILESAGMKLQWDKAHQRADFIGYGRTAAVRIGSTAGLIDNAQTRGDTAPFMYQGKLYIGASFVVMALEGGSLQWDAAHRTVSAKGLHMYAGVSQTYGGRIYSIVKRTGELFATNGKNGAKVKLATLGSPLYDGVTMSFQPTAGGLLYLRIHDNFGEPHLGNNVYTLVLKNGAVIRQAKVDYWQRYADNVTMYGNHLLLTDGRTLRMIQDGTGNVEQTLDLVKLGGADDTYFVEGADDDYLLIRPNRSGLLTLVDRKTGASVKLYKELLSAEEVTYAETNDTLYGDWLQFVKRDGDALYFRNTSPLEKDRDKLYAYKLQDVAGSGA